MREFNTFGPVNPRDHYHVNRVAVKAALRAKIAKGRYFTLNAARQTGKTTLFREVVAELEAEETHFGLLVSFETLRGYNRSEFYHWLRQKLLDALRRHVGPQAQILDWLAGVELTEHNGFGLALRGLCRKMGRRGVLIIDEFDAISAEYAEPMLAMFREMYLSRGEPGYDALASIILVGVRNIPALLSGTQSPFNIADQFTVPYFTPAEVADLLDQHTADTGQPFAPQVIAGIIRETEGQPFLVNRLGQLLTQEIAPDRSRPITAAHLDYALAELLRENNTHFYSLVSKAAPHRASLWRLLFYDERRTSFLDPVTQELIMYGILRVVESEDGLSYARLSNPIYRKMLLLRFAPSPDELPLNANGATVNRYVRDGILDFDGLLDSFRAFMAEHGVRLLRSQTSGRPLEISGQYLLLSYLTAALNAVGGHVTIESLTSAGELDILVFHRGRRFIVETKVWYGLAAYEQAQAQLAAYLTAAGLARGYLVIFDEQLATNPLASQTGEVFELPAGEKTLRVYLIAVRV
jgi:hypothetical protein